MPIVLLHPAGVYDNQRCVPTLAQQIARIYERDLKSYLYAGDPEAGQSLLHKQDMIDAFRRTVDRRNELPSETVILIGEPHAMGYDELQDQIGRLVHGENEWTTLRVPKVIAKLGAAAEEKLKPLVPDAIDQGENSFIRPFMVEMADDHYALDITRARRLLGWEPRHRIRTGLPALIDALKRDPLGWYRRNAITPPQSLQEAGDEGHDARAAAASRNATPHAACGPPVCSILQHRAGRAWLVTSPPTLSLQSAALTVSDVAAGIALIAFATLSLSWQHAWAHWACAALGMWVMFAPLAFWAPTPAATCTTRWSAC